MNNKHAVALVLALAVLAIVGLMVFQTKTPTGQVVLAGKEGSKTSVTANAKLENQIKEFSAKLAGKNLTGYDTTSLEKKLEAAKEALANGNLDYVSNQLDIISSSLDNLQLKTCAQQTGYICSPESEKKCDGKKLSASDTQNCCLVPCIGVDKCKNVNCRDMEKCVEGRCVKKTCEEADGYLCTPETGCMSPAVEFTDAEGKQCCTAKCVKEDKCRDVNCSPFEKCLEGKCILKKCNETEGEYCSSPATYCDSPGIEFVDATGKICCTAKCKDACENVQCPSYQTCVGGRCVIKSCKEQGAYECIPGTECTATWLPAETRCCTQPCVDACTLVTCAPNQTCNGGFCFYKTCDEQGGTLCKTENYDGCDGTLTESKETDAFVDALMCCIGSCTKSAADECQNDADCDDGDPSTSDTCTGTPKQCEYSFLDECQADEDCDDGDPSTSDTCTGTPKQCEHTPA